MAFAVASALSIVGRSLRSTEPHARIRLCRRLLDWSLFPSPSSGNLLLGSLSIRSPMGSSCLPPPCRCSKICRCSRKQTCRPRQAGPQQRSPPQVQAVPKEFFVRYKQVRYNTCEVTCRGQCSTSLCESL